MPRQSRRNAARLSFESLEPRAMLAADSGWAFALGGPVFEDDTAFSIGPDGYVYAAGNFSGTVDFDPGTGVVQHSGQGGNDAFVAKYTAQGGLAWARVFGAGGNDYIKDLEFDAAGNIYLTGHSSSATLQIGSTTLINQGSYDAILTKLDASGNFLWAHSVGSQGQDIAGDVTVSAAGDAYIVGSFRGTADFDPGEGMFVMTDAGGTGQGDAFVWKLDTNGNFQWARQLGNEHLDNGHRLDLGSDGHVYVAGTFRGTVDYGQPGNPLVLTSSSTDNADLFMVKLDEATGDAVWARHAAGPDHINAARLVADGAGSLYFAGGFIDTVTFGDGTPTLTSVGGTDTFLSKWNTDGNLLWAESVGGSGEDLVQTLALTPAGDPLVTFAFAGAADFDPGAGAAVLTSSGGLDGAALKLNADGTFGWVRQMSGPGSTEAHGIVQDSAGNVYVAGFFQNSVTLPTGHTLTRSGNGTFLMKLAFGEAATKFYVVDDAASNGTFEYDAAGATNGTYGLNGGNSAPRGAASTVAGDRVWVVDANRKVYVYDINGNLLGSWTAGTMASNATPEGIATNGTDVWIVDSKSDKVFKYAGAAGRLSGSQNAASSFNLNSGNTNAKDIVTNGASLWVVNDATTDKVFKYSVGGSLQGSWTISGAGSQPTGITIDPANVSDIWIVDNGTDRVYQFTGAASQTSGSQAAAASLALAAGNTNPQGIADPPPGIAAGEQQPIDNQPAALRAKQFEFEVTDRMHPGKAALPKTRATLWSRRDQALETWGSFNNDFAPLDVDRLGPTRCDQNTASLVSPADVSRVAIDIAFESAFAEVIL